MGSRGAEFILKLDVTARSVRLRTEAGELAGECSDLFGGLSVTESFHQSFYPARFEILRPHGSQDLPLPGFEDLEEEKKPHVERSFRGASSFAVSRAPLRCGSIRCHISISNAHAPMRGAVRTRSIRTRSGTIRFGYVIERGRLFRSSVSRSVSVFFLQFSRSGEV